MANIATGPDTRAKAMRLALFQPDIPPNTGTMLRLCACLGVAVDIIEPCGFPFSERSFKRAGMDYLAHADITRHLDWAQFAAARLAGPDAPRLVLLTTKGAVAYTDLTYRKDDILLVGQEGAGAPDFVHQAAAARVRIPIRPETRSLNVAVAAAMVLGEALRQTGGFHM
jgi:tRNA (cytidine/uridine-2'-O-)-methyltransferase